MSTITHRYQARGVCLQLFESREDEVLLSGPAGTGKSRACLEKLNLLCLLNPGMKGLILRKTLASLGTTALDTWRKFVLAEALSTGEVTFYGGSAQEAPQYRYRNGSRVFVGGMDKATRIMSSEYDVAYVQEATELSEDDFEAITTRLRNHQISFQQIIADCNPDSDVHWLKKRCDRGQTKMLHSRHEDNPTLFNDDNTLTTRGQSYIKKLDNLTGVRYRRLRKGEWCSAEGAIYEDFSSSIHLVDRFEIPETWTRYWAVDFGFTNPFVCQWWAEDPDGRLYLYREIYMTNRTVDVHAKQMLQQVTNDHGDWIEPKPAVIVTDHDAGDRQILERELGIGTRNAHKHVLDGIQQVQIRMREERIFFLRDSVCETDASLVDAKYPTSTIEEIPGYIWKPPPMGGALAGTVVKEEPFKRHDHGCDAMRYVVAQLDLAAKTRISVL